MTTRRPLTTAVSLTMALVLLVLVGCGPDSPSNDADSSVVIGAGLRGPKGLTATAYARGPTKQGSFALDHSGRLWIGTADSTDRGQDGVYLVTGAGADPVEVISGLHTALGLAWIDDTLYVAVKEQVLAYTGFDGTTFASHHTVVDLPSGVGESNNLAVAPDGHLLLGISSPCDHCTPTLPQSAAIVSFLPDGSGLQVYASGIRAPVGLAFYPGTADLLVSMNQRDDLGDYTPGDWLAQVQAGQAWGFPDCYGQGGPSCAGVPAPIATLDQHAAVSGVAVLTGPLGPITEPSAFVAEWATGTVARVALAVDGTTVTGTTHPFLTGLTNPVPVLATPDGSLLVGDWTTGTIYLVSGSTAA